ncbi:MAG: FUSC family membrane protein [Chitinophagaceae bacterium]
MEYSSELRKFINGQNFYTGVRVTAGVIIPVIILHYFNLLSLTMAIPLGALCVGLTDSPGPVHHRRNSLIASVIINFIIAIISGFLHAYTALVILEIIVFAMFFSLIGVYGSRINSIGLIALLVFVFNIDGRISNQKILENALLFSAGGIWYALFSLLLYRLRPYKLIQQLLGECLIELSAYMKTKAAFYKPYDNYNFLYDDLMKSQIVIQQQQEDLREILFKTRTIISESTTKGRILMLMFLDSIDLFERIMTSQQDYNKLHQAFDGTNILHNIYQVISALANELNEIGLAVQSGNSAESLINIDELLQQTQNAFDDLKKRSLNAETVENFITLRQILNNLQDISERIKRLQQCTTYDKKISKQFKQNVQLENFVTRHEVDPQLFLENLNLQSNQFRHAARLTIALLIGYIISLSFPLGHGYWILLTIVTIMKPAYSITRQRNINRLTGTFIGAAIGFLLLFYIENNTLLLIIMIIAMIISYSLLKVNYLISIVGITLYVLISFHFLYPTGFKTVLTDRIIDTIIGSVIASVISISVLPVWQHEQIGEYILKALEANKNYFLIVAKTFAEKIVDITAFKLARKAAFVALANLSDNFQRMVSEPKSKQQNLKEYHQFVSTSHMLTSYIASLSYYAQGNSQQFSTIEFEPFIKQIDEQFKEAINIYNHSSKKNISINSFNQNVKMTVEELLSERKKEMREAKNAETSLVRKKLSFLKPISDQFQLISTIVADESKILMKIYV